MPKIGKAERRERKRRKAINGKYLGVRYATRRAGEGLLRREVERTTRPPLRDRSRAPSTE